MNALLLRILASVAHSMWQDDRSLSRYTAETAEHELNLAFHYARRLGFWFPWLDCDFDVTKTHFNRERPDIILHRRGSNAANFLVVEVKRERSRGLANADLKQVRARWFATPLRYRFGASVVLDDDTRGFDVRLLTQRSPQQQTVLSKADLREPLSLPRLRRVQRADLVRLTDRLLEAKRTAPEADTTALEREIDERVHRLYGLTADEIKLVEEGTR